VVAIRGYVDGMWIKTGTDLMYLVTVTTAERGKSRATKTVGTKPEKINDWKMFETCPVPF